MNSPLRSKRLEGDSDPMSTTMSLDHALTALRAAQPDAWVSADGLHRIHEPVAAAMIGVTARTLRAWREQGCGPRFYAVAGRLTYAVGDVLIWLQTRSHGPRAVSLAARGST